MYIMDYFWHKDLDRIPHITGSFIEAFASANLPIKATQTRGYKVCLCFVKKDDPSCHGRTGMQPFPHW